MSLFVRKSENVQPSQWTIETLREHVVALFNAYDRRYEQGRADDAARYAQARVSDDTRYAQRFESSQSAINAALAAAKEAVAKAEAAADKRFDSVNEFRNTLADQQRNLLPRGEAVALMTALEAKIENLAKDIANLREYRSQATGKGEGANALWGYLAGAAGLAVAVISVLTR